MKTSGIMSKCLCVLITFTILSCATLKEDRKSEKTVRVVKNVNRSDERVVKKRDPVSRLRLLETKVSANSKNPEFNFELSVEYLRAREIEFASEYLERAIKYATNRQDKGRYRSFRFKLIKDTYKICKKNNDIESFELFLELYPSSVYSDEARRTLEELMYKVAIDENNKELYNMFLKRFPSSVHLQSIHDHLDELSFEEVMKENRISSYLKFIQEYPFSNFKSAALDRVDRLRYENVRVIDTIAAYDGFVQKYPANKYIGSARNRIEEIKFSRIKKGNAVHKYDKYIKDNPQGVFVSVSLEKIDELRYAEAKRYETAEALEEFIRNYPDSNFKNQATKMVDLYKYEEVEKEDSIKGYKMFVEDYPNSQFKYDAQENMEKLMKKGRVIALLEKVRDNDSDEDIDRTIEIYKEILNVEDLTVAHFGIGKLLERKGDIEEDYDKKINYYYQAATEYKVVMRKKPDYRNITKEYDNLMSKRSAEEKVMNNAQLVRQELSAPFTAKLIKYSKSPVLFLSNVSTKSKVKISINNEGSELTKTYSLQSQKELKKVLKPGRINISIKGARMNKNFVVDLHPYYEYKLRVK